ncbi:MAG: DUF4013 domain-containing protein [Halobacteriota archaeon]
MAIDIEAMAKYPMESDDWMMTILIGGVLSIFSFLIIPAFILYGYFVRVLRAGMANNPEPPQFDDWGGMLVEGLVAFVIGLVYQIIPIIVFWVTVGGSIMAMASGSNAGVGAGFLGLIGGGLISFILALVFGYVGMVGVANYAHEGNLGAGFDIGVITDVAFSGKYAIPWLYGVGFLIVAAIIVGVLNIVPILGSIIGAFVMFYAGISAGKLVGMGYADALGITSAGRGPETTDAAI